MAALDMYDFFHKEFKHLKALTGLNQWERLNDSPNAAAEINEIITALVDETKRDPFKMIKPEVLQRVIHDAMMNDDNFIGLNPKFVRKALNAWWGIYGQKLLEARDQRDKEDFQPVKLTKEQNEKVDSLINSYLQTLRSNKVPKLTKQEIQEEGQVRPKAHVYHSTDLSYQKQIEERVRKGRELYFRENYPGATENDLKKYLESFES